jgi:DNA-directed RNA polymerase subunit RPC12/RpoP
MSDSIVPLARKLKLPIALYRLEGGYGVHPRWSDVVRRGRMKGGVSRVIYPDEYAAMTDEQLFETIRTELHVDEAVVDGTYRHKKTAEYLERAIYVCPYCGLAEFESHDDVIECKTCGRKVRYLPTKELEGVGYEHPFRFVADWYAYQSDFTNSLDVSLYNDAPMFTDIADLREVIPYESKKLLAEGATLSLYGNRIVITMADGTLDMPYDSVDAVAVLGRNKLNIYYEDNIYQIKSSKRFNALKYVNIYHRHKNLTKGDSDGKFMGL